MNTLKVGIGAVILAFLLSACGTIQLNPMVTGTQCQTREQCVKDLNLPNPKNPTITFVVDPYLMDKHWRALVGTPALGGDNLHGNVELCVAKALGDEFGNSAKISFTKDELVDPVEIKINKMVAQSTGIGGYIKINYTLINKGETIGLAAKSDRTTGWSSDIMTKTAYSQACQVLAKQVRGTLAKEGVELPVTSSKDAGL